MPLPPESPSTGAQPISVPIVRAAEPSVHEPPGRPWELELLISGAVVFALLQLPGVMESQLDRFAPHLAGVTYTVVTAAFAFLTLVLYALILSFVVHLAARAYWVGLVGLDAVFPHGVRWEETRYGPLTRSFYQRRQPSLQALTDRADRFCSIIFSFSFAFAFMVAGGSVVAGLTGLLAWGVSRALLGGEHVLTLYTAGFAVLLLTTTLPLWLDRRLGERIPPGGWLARWVEGANRMQYFVMATGPAMPIWNVLASNVNRRAVYAVFFGMLVLLEGALFLRLEARDQVPFAAYAFLPGSADAQGLNYRHYADQRPAGRVYTLEPMIQSEVVEGPFVRLFLPYVPRRHNALVAERCPEVGAAAGAERAAEAQRQAVLDCLAALQPVTLDGEPLADLRYRFATDPRSEIRGLVAYLPVAGLSPGEHELVVAPLERPGEDREADEPPPPPHRIAFWVAPGSGAPPAGM